MRDGAARLVVRTGDWPGFSTLYQRAYEIGLSAAARRLAAVDGVVAVLLRSSGEARRWVPGLSDYDLTVLTEPCSAREMFRGLDALWRQYRRIKRWAPQMGEMEVSSVDEYSHFLRLGPTPPASIKRMDPLVVKPGSFAAHRALDQESRPPQEREFLLDALFRYQRFAFPAWLHHDPRSHVDRRRIDRLLRNVVARLERLGRPVSNPVRGAADQPLAGVFQDLSEACRAFNRHGVEHGIEVPRLPRDRLDAVTPAVGELCSDIFRRAGVQHLSVILWNAYLSDDCANVALIVPDEMPTGDIRKLLSALARVQQRIGDLRARLLAPGEMQRYFPALTCPVLFSQSMWTCWRTVSPFDAIAVAATGRPIIGDHDVSAAIAEADLRRGAQVRCASLLPLKNNWRPFGGPGSPQLYGAMLSHVTGCVEAADGRAMVAPARHEFSTAEEGYCAVSTALTTLCETLSR